MDPLAHTLAGAALGELGLARRTPLARTTLIIGANLPDVDAFAKLVSEEAERSFRRGWTHGVLAMVVLPLLLTAVMRLFDRRVAPKALLPVACIGIWSHPLLDWLNTYGIRLLMPFDGTWFYGDALFIVDPILWLAMGAVLVLAHSRTPRSLLAWVLLGAAVTLVVTTSERPPLATKIAWVLAMVALAVARWRRWGEGRYTRWAQIAFAGGVLYIGVMIGASNVAELSAASWLADRGVESDEQMSAPAPGNPFLRTVVAGTPEEYRVVEIDWLRGTIDEVRQPIPRGRRDEIVEAARAEPSIRGFVGRLRFPIYEVKSIEGGWQVSLRDARRAGRSRSPSGMVVRLDANLNPIGVHEEPD
jgi:inner membrane protein